MVIMKQRGTDKPNKPASQKNMQIDFVFRENICTVQKFKDNNDFHNFFHTIVYGFMNFQITIQGKHNHQL